MILLSLALVVASVGTLVGGLAASSQPLVWTSLAAGLAAVACVAGSVVQRRARPTGAGVPGSPTLPPPPAAPPAADPAADQASDGGPVAGVPVTGGVFPSDRFSAGPRPPLDAPEPRAVTAGEVFAAGSTAAPEARDTPERDDTPRRAGIPSMPSGPVDRVAPSAAAPDAPVTAREPLDRSEQLSGPSAEPPLEDVAVRDALRVAQLADAVTVRDGHPRYHLAGCPTLAGTADRAELPVSVARRSGFTPCGVCTPDRTLLARSRR